MALNDRQRTFIAEYLVDLNGAQAAIRAGYSPAGAGVTAAKLLTNPIIKDAVEKAKEARGVRTQITADRVLEELGKVAFSDIRRVAKWTAGCVVPISSNELDDDTAAAISEVNEKSTSNKFGEDHTVRVKMHDKLKALEMLAKHLGMFRDQDESDRFNKMPLHELILLVKQKLPIIEAGK